MRFAKGHGTGNDFIIVPDPHGQVELAPRLVSALCARRTGIGADGVLRVVRAGAMRSSAAPSPAGAPEGAEWFMDYRNADGSIAEMCGNGIRVFARYLIDAGLAAGPEIDIATRAGIRRVRHESGDLFTVDMGPVLVGGPGLAVVGGRRLEGLRVSVGNPHLACLADAPVAGFDLAEPPVVDAGMFPDGVNVELVRPTGARSVEMRVHERGSGETLSCGTGAVAAAVAAAAATGEWPGRGARWQVDVPGGRLVVVPDEAASLLTGPAQIVADGELSPRWLAGNPALTSAPP